MGNDFISIFPIISENNEWNWTAVGAIATSIADFLTVVMLVTTVYFSKKQILAEEKKNKHTMDDIYLKQKQQTYEIAMSFLDKYIAGSLSTAISGFTEQIRLIRYLIGDNNFKYLEELRKKAISLESLNKQQLSMRTISEREHAEGKFCTENQVKFQKLIDEINEINCWFAKKIDDIAEDLSRTDGFNRVEKNSRGIFL